MQAYAFIHPTADVDSSVTLGTGTKVWHEVQLRPRVVVGLNCILGKGVYVDEDVIIGNNVKIQNRASIYKDCEIEDGVFIGPHVCFTNDVYPRSINLDGSIKSADDWTVGSTRVAYGAAIGAGSIVLPNRTIGRFALVGAGSVVTKDVPAFGLVVGNPARLIGYVCSCGRRIEFNDGIAECGDCGQSYVRDEHVGVRQEGSDAHKRITAPITQE
jgi:acetyltransferase-like isoleucine patch superfamily enzyme